MSYLTSGPGCSTFHSCANKLCERLVGPMAAYCCAPCALADQDGYEIHEHSAGCGQRNAQRTMMSTPQELAGG